MRKSKQVQNAGNGSNQCQIENVIINNGISEERAISIFKDQFEVLRGEFSEEAYRVANERVERFEKRLLPKLNRIDDTMSFFSEPEFQVRLRQAQLSAVTTDFEEDYDLLSELLVCHIQKGKDKTKNSGIHRAITIATEIDSKALCGLTVAHAVSCFIPASGKCIEGLSTLNEMFYKLIQDELPSGVDWIDHLEVLGTIRWMNSGQFKKLEDIYADALDGYVCVGIKYESEEYEKAMDLLDKSGINREILIFNECLDGYCRIPVPRIQTIVSPQGGVILSTRKQDFQLSTNQIEALNMILNMYSKDTKLLKQARNTFLKLWDDHDILKKIRLWWDDIPSGFSINQVGQVLAQTNAKRCDPSLPDMI